MGNAMRESMGGKGSVRVEGKSSGLRAVNESWQARARELELFFFVSLCCHWIELACMAADSGARVTSVGPDLGTLGYPCEARSTLVPTLGSSRRRNLKEGGTLQHCLHCFHCSDFQQPGASTTTSTHYHSSGPSRLESRL